MWRRHLQWCSCKACSGATCRSPCTGMSTHFKHTWRAARWQMLHTAKAKSLCDTDSVSGKELPPVTGMSLRKGSTLHPNLAVGSQYPKRKIAIPEKKGTKEYFLKTHKSWLTGLEVLDSWLLLCCLNISFFYFVTSKSRMTATSNITVATDMSDFDFTEHF